MRWRLFRAFFIALAVITVSLSVAPEAANAATDWNTTCVQKYMAASHAPQALGIAPDEVEQLIPLVANAVGLSTAVMVLPCTVSKVQAQPPNSVEGVPAGDYVFYDEIWLREVIGDDKVQAAFIFGHEFGHIFKRHFESSLSRKAKETEADAFGACAVARLYDTWPDLWSRLENLIGRIRADKDLLYPTKIESLAVARTAFIKCGGHIRTVTEQAAAPSAQNTSPAALARDLTQLPPEIRKAVKLARDNAVLGEDAAARARNASKLAEAAVVRARAGAAGTWTYDDAAEGKRYAGEAARGKRWGYGVMMYHDPNLAAGDSYAGQYSDGVRAGSGVYTYGPAEANLKNNYVRYEGDWANGDYNGFGVNYFINGTELEGPAAITMKGPGVMKTRNGQIIAEGEFLESNLNGYGVTWASDGSIDKMGIWKDGVLTKSMRPAP